MKQLYSDISEPVKDLASLVFNHFGKSPMSWTGIDKLTEYAHNEQFVDRVLDLYAYLSNSSTILLGINPSQYYKIIYKFQLAAKSLDVDRKLIVDCYLYLANYAIKVYNYNYADILDFIESHSFSDISTDLLAKKISLLSAALRSYSETLFCDEHTISGEIYSPIYIDDGFVIARRYRWLNASELRKELKEFPYQSVNMYIKYKGIDNPPHTDIVGNLLTSINISQYMYEFYIEVINLNNDIIVLDSIEKIDIVLNHFLRVVPILSRELKKMDIRHRLWSKILCEYFSLKPYTDVIGENWRPRSYPLEIKIIEDDRKPVVRVNNQINQSNDEKFIINKLFELNDPRVYWI